ncbi:class I SAM-dependent methyltransferase [Paenibacillus rhizophilus]|uniref:Class I SAM-dependent methyltransferase n=1 Tax=Paenibacillus rhizophilus TaxID=1850366 RepID=A0A3N9NVK9_9BACL|nr:class I SAM-dependent methyltransferase [Paenibacillus rhizophilus]RQW07958.1 class I SAM-dependent methyltransferase [Paenibacillus rhizophilus]
MITKLLQTSGKPSIFQEGTSQLWTDDYISRQLLASHLDPMSDGASRRPEVIDSTVHWIDHYLCRQDNAKEILDLGCGPGLYAQRLAKLGYSVTDIDFSKLSIEYAKRQATRGKFEISYLNENYILYDYPNPYDIILMIYCDFGVIDELSRDTLLTKIYATLKPGGSFVFDVFRPQKYLDHKETKTWSMANGGFWRPGPYLSLDSSYWYEDSGVQLDQYIIVDESSRFEVYNIWDKTYTRDEISSILLKYGFVDLEFYNNFSGNLYTEDNDTLCVLARKK